jgi:hypothetical protein
MRTQRTHALIFHAAWALCLAVGILVSARPASARPAGIVGVVAKASSRWTADGSRIVTEAVVSTASGDVTVSQLGGTADGLTMRTFPGSAILEPGMEVNVTAHAAVDLSAHPAMVVDDVSVTGGFEFVRTGPTKGGKSLYWKSGCVKVTLDAAGTDALAGSTEATVVSQVIAHWNTSIASCSYMNLAEQPRKTTEVGRDFVNVIKFRDTSWCRPAIRDDPMRCYAPMAAGLTTVVYVDDPTNPRDGEIVDADVELNNVDFSISNDNGMSGDSDLANTLTHELGHLLGLEHTCLTPSDPARVDDGGRDVPRCMQLAKPSPILETTMYPFQDPREIKKASLSTDDVNSMCVTYPIANDPGTCGNASNPSAGCCSAHPNVPGSLLLFLTTGLLMLRRGRTTRTRN